MSGGGCKGRLAVQHDRQAFAVGAVDSVEDLIRVQIDAGADLDMGVLHQVRGADRAHIDQVGRAQTGEF
ncbi:hypothetical protein D3C77_734970 [compost metagenome]